MDDESSASRKNSGQVSPLHFISYFFCSHTDDRTMDPKVLLCSLIHSIICQESSLAKPLQTRFQHVDDEVLGSLWALWDVLDLLASNMHERPFYIIIDAVDELRWESWAKVLDGLWDFTKRRKNVRVFATSRTEPEIQSKFLSWAVPNISLEDYEQNRRDVKVFLQDTIHEYAILNSFDDQITEKIIHEFSVKANGMFLWASLAWNQFKDVVVWRLHTIQEKLEELEQLPPGLDALYHRILSRVEVGSRQATLHALQWIIFVRRPLSVEEFRVALALDKQPKNISQIDTWISIRAFLKKNCAHVVTFTSSDEVTLVHESFKNFLTHVSEVRIRNSIFTNEFFINPRTANGSIGGDCLTYIALEDFGNLIADVSDSPASQKDFVNSLRKQDTFLHYATSHWAEHVRLKDDEPKTWHAFSRIISRRVNLALLCLGMPDENDYSTYATEPPVFLASRYGLTAILAELAADGHDLNQSDAKGNPLIHHCALKERWAVVDMLLHLGAAANSQNSHGDTLLTRMVRDGNVKGAFSWLERPGMDVNAQDPQGVTALHVLVTMDFRRMHNLYDVLLNIPGLDANARDHNGQTPLVRASYWGKKKAARKLLSSPKIRVDESRQYGQSFLLNSMAQDWTDIVMGILRNIQNVDGYSDSGGQTILHLAIRKGMRGILETACEKQTSIINTPDNMGMTALHCAAQEADVIATETLLRHNASKKARSRMGTLPLHHAAAQGSKTIVVLLVQDMPKELLDQKDHLGNTALHWAVTSGNDALVEFLATLDGINFWLKDQYGRTPAALAAAHASSFALRQILSHPIKSSELNRTDCYGNNLLHSAVAMANESTIPLLLEDEGLERNNHNIWGKTPLDRSPLQPPSELFQSMRDAGLKHSKKFLLNRENLWMELKASVPKMFERTKHPEQSSMSVWAVILWTEDTGSYTPAETDAQCEEAILHWHGAPSVVLDSQYLQNIGMEVEGWRHPMYDGLCDEG